MKRASLSVLSLLLAIGMFLPAATPAPGNTNVMTYPGMNVTAGPFTSPAVRQAVYVALNRDAIAAPQDGSKVVSIVTPSAPNPAVDRSCNLTLARQLLANAAFRTDSRRRYCAYLTH